MFLEFPTQFELKDFFNIESFDRISQHFLSMNSIHQESVKKDNFKRWYFIQGPHMVPHVPTNDDLKTKSFEQPQYYPEEKELHLIKDYLVPFFKMKTRNFFLETENKAKDFHIPQERFYYLDGQLDYLEFCLIDSKSMRLKKIFSKMISNFRSEINELIKKIDNDLMPNSIKGETSQGKIKLKLSKKEICILFKELAQAEKLSTEQTEEKEMARLIENNFMYYNKRAKNYFLLQNVSNYLIKLRTLPEYNTETKIFQDIFCNQTKKQK